MIVPPLRQAPGLPVAWLSGPGIGPAGGSLENFLDLKLWIDFPIAARVPEAGTNLKGSFGLHISFAARSLDNDRQTRELSRREPDLPKSRMLFESEHVHKS